MTIRRRLKRLYEKRGLEQYFDGILEPLDSLVRMFNGNRHLPPLRVRRNSGALSTFETSAASALGFVQGAVGVQPTERILDIGCGAGAIALQLRGYLEPPGSYTGIDVHAPSIRWARRHIETGQLFRFRVANLRNEQYNPEGSQTAATYVFPFGDESFTVIFAKSLFTHLRPDETENYVKEIARLLAPGGHCLATFFLLTPEREALRKKGKSLSFAYGEGVWRYHDPDVPERACAYRPAYLMELLGRHHLELARPILHGYQDALLLRKVRDL